MVEQSLKALKMKYEDDEKNVKFDIFRHQRGKAEKKENPMWARVSFWYNFQHYHNEITRIQEISLSSSMMMSRCQVDVAQCDSVMENVLVWELKKIRKIMWGIAKINEKFWIN